MGHWCAPCEPDPVLVILYHLGACSGIAYGQWNETEGKIESNLLWLAFSREPDTFMTQRNKCTEVHSPVLVLEVV